MNGDQNCVGRSGERYGCFKIPNDPNGYSILTGTSKGNQKD